jgi:hypothetical protein
VSGSGLLYLDSDLFVLLSGAGLLDEVIQVAGFEQSAARRLDPLPYMLERGGLAQRYPEGVRERASAWCWRIASVEVVPPRRLHDRLIREPDLDPGEALLFAAAAESAASVVTTGDKRACRALAAVDLPELCGKVLCLEACLLLLLKALDFSFLIDSLAIVREYHQTLRVLLPRGASTSESDLREGLDSYWRDLLAQTGDLLRRP